MKGLILLRLWLILASAVIVSAHPFMDDPDATDPPVPSDPPAVENSAPDPNSIQPVQPAKPDETQPPDETPGDTRHDPVGKRVFGVLPNYRTANSADDFMPLTVKQKMYVGLKDSTDYPVYPVAAAFAGLYQLMNQHPGFGQGVEGYAKRFGTSYGDQAIGNLMTESLMPSLLHQDPRYFRLGYGNPWHRAFYAATRIFVAPMDNGKQTFNFSEVIGNSIAAGIGNIYYPQERGLYDNAQRLYTSLLTDSFSQVLKEFWPDIKRWYKKKRHKADGDLVSPK